LREGRLRASTFGFVTQTDGARLFCEGRGDKQGDSPPLRIESAAQPLADESLPFLVLTMAGTVRDEEAGGSNPPARPFSGLGKCKAPRVCRSEVNSTPFVADASARALEEESDTYDPSGSGSPRPPNHYIPSFSALQGGS
jgi:hypothetical protein